MSCEHWIVATLADDAEVIYDLDSSFGTFVAARILTQPPRRRRAWASSMLTDGSVATADAFENREIQVVMRPRPGADAQEQAEDLRALHRLFSSGGYWLRHRPAGVAAPVFYRLLPAEIDFENYYETDMPDRDVTFTIPADPFGYGLPESGTATVVNDPTQPNGMRFVLDDVKGDVPAPLRLEAENSLGTQSLLVASTTDAGGFYHAAPTVVDTPAFPTSAWDTVNASQSDATAVGGTKVYAYRASGAGTTRLALEFDFGNVKPGEYRLYVRAQTDMPVSGLRLFCAPSQMALGQWAMGNFPTASSPAGNKWTWVDSGVMRMPFSSRSATAWDSPPATRGRVRTVAELTAGQLVEVDHAILVPAPGADLSSGTLGLFAFRGAPSTDVDFTLDGTTEAVWSTSSYLEGGQVPWQGAGGFPRVVPGAATLVPFVRWAGGAPVSEYVAATTELTWSYHPRYLYLRGD